MSDDEKQEIGEVVEAIEAGDEPAEMPPAATDTTAPGCDLVYGLKPRVKSDGRVGR